MGYHLFIHSSTQGHLHCLHFGEVVNRTALSMHVQAFHFSRVDTQEWDCWVISKCMSKFLRNYQTVFQSDCAVLHSHLLKV